MTTDFSFTYNPEDGSFEASTDGYSFEIRITSSRSLYFASCIELSTLWIWTNYNLCPEIVRSKYDKIIASMITYQSEWEEFLRELGAVQKASKRASYDYEK